MYDYKNEIPVQNGVGNIYSLCGVNEEGKAIILLTYYSENDSLSPKNISIELGKNAEYEIYLVDDIHNGEVVEVTNSLSLELKLFDMILIKEK